MFGTRLARSALYSFQLTISCCSSRTRDLAHLPAADRSTRCRWPKRIGTFRGDETVARKTAILYLPDSGLRRDGQTPLWKYYFNAFKTLWAGWYYFRAEITRLSLSSLLDIDVCDDIWLERFGNSSNESVRRRKLRRKRFTNKNKKADNSDLISFYHIDFYFNIFIWK